jgi:hypothetical protein
MRTHVADDPASGRCAFASRASLICWPPAPAARRFLRDHPLLEDGDITAALEYAARQSDHPVLHVA